MREMVLVRHGQTAHNRLGLIQGRTDTPLNDKGIEQARGLAVELARLSFDRVYSSPLERAFRTAEIILDGRETVIETDDRLTEIDQGEWTLKKASELFVMDPRYRVWVKTPTLQGTPGGETIEEVARRVESFIGDMGGDKVLVVAHAGCIAVMRAVIDSMPLDRAWELLPRNGEALFLKL